MFYGYTLKTKFRNMMLTIIIFLTFGDWNPPKFENEVILEVSIIQKWIMIINYLQKEKIVWFQFVARNTIVSIPFTSLCPQLLMKQQNCLIRI
jgi:hypothetical protein